MTWAITASAVIGAGTSMYAADQQKKGAAGAAGMVGDQYQQSRNDLSPYRTSGGLANLRLQTLLGLSPTTGPDWEAYLRDNPDVAASPEYASNPALHYQKFGQSEGRALPTLSGTGGAGYGSLTKAFTGADLANEPGYAFAQAEGEKALNRAASAAGRYDSGATLKALTRYGNDYATTKFDDANSRDMANRQFTLNALTGQQSTGANAAGMTANLGASAAGAGANYLTQGADAGAAGLVGAANAASSGAGSYLAYQNNQSTLNYLKGLRSGSTGANGGWGGSTTGTFGGS